MSKRELPALLAASLLVSVLFTGCFTVLMHPRPSQLVDEESGARRECYDCHAGADAYHFQDPFAAPYYDYYSPLWYPYYARPWWYSDYWYDQQQQPDGNPAETGGRHGWTRPGGGTGSPRGDLPITGPVPQQPPPDNGAKEPKPADDKKETEKEGRHPWVRGSKGGR